MMKVQKTLGRVRAGSRSSVMSGKAGACLVIKSSLSRYINTCRAIYFSRTLITGMFDLASHFQAAGISLALITV